MGIIAHDTWLAASWAARKFRATVINDIWPEMIFFTLVATMVAAVSEQTDTSLAISNQMLTVLGTVLGLVVSFRTTSAYDRFWEGRKLWSSINLASRNLALLIWVHVPIDRDDKKTVKKDELDEKTHTRQQARLRAIIEKKSMVNLIQAFSVSVKHMLRGEPGIYYEDLYPLICFLPRYASHLPEQEAESQTLPLWSETMALRRTASKMQPQSPQTRPSTGRRPHRSLSSPGPNLESQQEKKNKRRFFSTLSHSNSRDMLRREATFRPERVLPEVKADRPLAPAHSPPKQTIYDYIPPLVLIRPFAFIFKLIFAKHESNPMSDAQKVAPTPNQQADRTALGKKRRPGVVDSNVPLEISLFLSSYLAWLLKNGLLQPAIASALTNTISSLQDTIASLDRIRTTPIPYAYQAHLRMTIWLYLFFLPFQIYTAFGYLTIPATAFAAFLLLGFLEIGEEIENPFNYDLNDLDLDHFCLSIERELHEITAHPCPDPDSYVFSPWNQPFAPFDRRSAEVINRETTHDYHRPETGMPSVRKTLLENWKQVNDVTTDWSRWSG